MLIFLPVRNGGDYIAAAIRSVIEQEDPDWRLIVLENGSTDSTVSIVRDFADPRIELLVSAEPLDIVANWQRILRWLDTENAGAELVTTIGHDDLLDRAFVGEMKRLAANNPDATLLHCQFRLIDADGALIRPARPIPVREAWQDFATALCWGLRDSYGTGYVFRASDFRAVGGFPDLPRLLYADHLLFIRLAQRGIKCATDRTLCAYRLHGGSTSGAVSIATLNAYVEAVDRFVATMRSDFSLFFESTWGRDALSCLLGREIVNLGRPAVRPLLTQSSRETLDNL